MMDVIATALAAGASAGLSGTASEAVKDAYALLKMLLKRKFTGRDQARAALEAEQTEPGVWQVTIGRDLDESGAATDEQILTAARELLALTTPGGSRSRVDASHAQGVQVGDHNTQTNTFH